MVNYSLEEFKSWAEETNLPTTPLDWKETIKHYQNKPQEFEKVAQRALVDPNTVNAQFFAIVKQWKQWQEEREREREREQFKEEKLIW